MKDKMEYLKQEAAKFHVPNKWMKKVEHEKLVETPEIPAQLQEAKCELVSLDGDNDCTNTSSSVNGVDHILEDIVQAFDSWTQRILTLETDLRRNSNIRRDIRDYLQKQVLDGLIKREDANELQCVVDLWTNLHRAYVCKQIGADFADQEILSHLLDLFNLKQISKSFVIRVALELLCRVKQED